MLRCFASPIAFKRSLPKFVEVYLTLVNLARAVVSTAVVATSYRTLDVYMDKRQEVPIGFLKLACSRTAMTWFHWLATKLLRHS